MTMQTISQSSWMGGICHKLQRATKKKAVPEWNLRTNISKDIPPASCNDMPTSAGFHGDGLG